MMHDRKGRWILSSILILVLGLAGFSQLKQPQQQSVQTIKKVATEALVLYQSAPFYWEMESLNGTNSLQVKKVALFDNVKPASPVRQIITTYRNPPDFTHKIVPAEINFSAWRNKTTQLANQLFVPGTAAYKQITQAPEKESHSNFNTVAIDGGVRKIQWGKIHFKGNASAIVKGKVDDWASYAQWQTGKGYVPASPHGISTFSMTLKKINGTWKVETLSKHFAPGSEP